MELSDVVPKVEPSEVRGVPSTVEELREELVKSVARYARETALRPLGLTYLNRAHNREAKRLGTSVLREVEELVREDRLFLYRVRRTNAAYLMEAKSAAAILNNIEERLREEGCLDSFGEARTQFLDLLEGRIAETR